MTKCKSIIILSATALVMSAAPSFAQSYGSGSSANTIPQTQSRSIPRSSARTLNKAEKKRLEAQRQKERFEAQLAKKENATNSYGSGTTKPSAPSYGSGTDKAPPASSYGSGTNKTNDAKKEEDQVMIDGEYVMKEGDFMADKISTPATASPALPLNCPAGTTAQSNGTCLLSSGSFPTG